MDEIERLNRMSPSEAAAERARLAAHQQRLDEYNNGVMVNGVRTYPKEFPTMSRYNEARADAAPTMKEVKIKDRTGREYSEFRGGSMREWCAPWMLPGQLQLGVFIGNESMIKFKQRMQVKEELYKQAVAKARGV